MKRKPIILIFTHKDINEITADIKRQKEMLSDYYFFINPPAENEKPYIKMLKYSKLTQKERGVILSFKKKYLDN